LYLVRVIFRTLGMDKFRVRIGLRDRDSSKYIGSDENWAAAERALRVAAEGLAVPFEENTGEAAFYGPKIDFVVEDVLGREWQLGTVQVDYNLPERFNMCYVGEDNREHRPIMIHRAPFGSLERFVGLLIEHFGGNFPTWLAPEQVRIITVSDKFNGYAADVQRSLRERAIRVTVDSSADKLPAKIRRGEVDRVPHMFIVGAEEANSGRVSVRSRMDSDFSGPMELQLAAEYLSNAIASRKL
jgi:threonyl-tRNA synthetase